MTEERLQQLESGRCAPPPLAIAELVAEVRRLRSAHSHIAEIGKDYRCHAYECSLVADAALRGEPEDWWLEEGG